MRAYTWQDAVELGLNPQTYIFLNEAKILEVMLHFKVWGKKCNLQCYFQDIRTGDKFILNAFSSSTRQYTPLDKRVNFSEPGNENGLYGLITAPDSKGNIVWKHAFLLLPPERRELIEARILDVFEG